MISVDNRIDFSFVNVVPWPILEEDDELYTHLPPTKECPF